MKKRHNLYMFRCSKRLSQQEIADKIGVDRMTYSKIENGKSDGSMRFWNALKEAYKKLSGWEGKDPSEWEA